jgi:hypothetical protein
MHLMQPSWRLMLSTPLVVPARSAGTLPTSSAVMVGIDGAASSPTGTSSEYQFR